MSVKFPTTEDIDILLQCVETQGNTIKTLLTLAQISDEQKERLRADVEDSLKLVKEIRKNL
jgi:hypothetical protein